MARKRGIVQSRALCQLPNTVRRGANRASASGRKGMQQVILTLNVGLVVEQYVLQPSSDLQSEGMVL